MSACKKQFIESVVVFSSVLALTLGAVVLLIAANFANALILGAPAAVVLCIAAALALVGAYAIVTNLYFENYLKACVNGPVACGQLFNFLVQKVKLWKALNAAAIAACGAAAGAAILPWGGGVAISIAMAAVLAALMACVSVLDLLGKLRKCLRI